VCHFQLPLQSPVVCAEYPPSLVRYVDGLASKSEVPSVRPAPPSAARRIYTGNKQRFGIVLAVSLADSPRTSRSEAPRVRAASCSLPTYPGNLSKAPFLLYVPLTKAHLEV